MRKMLRAGAIVIFTALLVVGSLSLVAQSKPSCNPAYPKVCIPSPPPELDCKNIHYRNFQVLPPDPHQFDRDQDGIGCEGKRK